MSEFYSGPLHDYEQPEVIAALNDKVYPKGQEKLEKLTNSVQTVLQKNSYPILSVTSRLKSSESIKAKFARNHRHFPLCDLYGIRVYVEKPHAIPNNIFYLGSLATTIHEAWKSPMALPWGNVTYRKMGNRWSHPDFREIGYILDIIFNRGTKIAEIQVVGSDFDQIESQTRSFYEAKQGRITNK